MKKIFYNFFIVIAAVSLIGCSGDNDPNDGKFHVDPQSGFVEFANGGNMITTSIICGESSVSVPVALRAPSNIDGLTVDYTITDIEGTSAGVITHSGQVYFPKGELESEIMIDYPEALSSTLEFVITLASTSRDNVEIGAVESTNPEAITVRIATPVDFFVGTYDVVEDDQFTYESVITAGDADNEIIISNLYDSDPASQTRLLINNDGTFSYPDYADNLLFTSTNPALGNVFVEGIAGTFDCNGGIDLNFVLRYGPNEDQTTDPVNAILTRQ